MHLARLRTLFFLASNACASFLGAGIYLEYHLGPSLNPLCLLQRCLYAAYGVICLLAVVHAPGKRGWRAYSGSLLLIAASGAAIAGRQVFLQASAPEDMASCLANLHYLVDTQPYLKVLILVLQGNAGCPEINWSLFGLSIPEWSLLAFTGLSLFALYFFLIGFMRFRSMDADVRD